MQIAYGTCSIPLTCLREYAEKKCSLNATMHLYPYIVL